MTGDNTQQVEGTTGTGERFCIFSVAGEVVGVPISALFEVVSEPLITPLPEVPGGLVGLMNFRGEILPVIDLGPWIGIPVVPRLQVMVVSGGGYQIGVAVDAIRDMVEAVGLLVGVEGGQDAPLGGALQAMSSDRFRGVTSAPARVWVVDVSHLVEGLMGTFSSVVEVA